MSFILSTKSVISEQQWKKNYILYCRHSTEHINYICVNRNKGILKIPNKVIFQWQEVSQLKSDTGKKNLATVLW